MARAKRGERAARREEWSLLVGRAFRCGDGLIRWITYLSTLDNFGLLWLDERTNTWFSGGTVKASKWEGGEEVRAPQPGETYKQADPMGRVGERTVQQRETDGQDEGGEG